MIPRRRLAVHVESVPRARLVVLSLFFGVLVLWFCSVMESLDLFEVGPPGTSIISSHPPSVAADIAAAAARGEKPYAMCEVTERDRRDMALLGTTERLRTHRTADSFLDKCEKKKDSNYVIERQSSYPFVTGDSLREIADCVLDESACELNLAKCTRGEGTIVFVKTDWEETWFVEFHPKMPARYVLITGNSDRSAPDSPAGRATLRRERGDANSKLIAWFAMNANEHFDPKLRGLPHGLNNVGRPNGEPGHHASHWGAIDPLADSIERWRRHLAEERAPHELRVIASFSAVTNPKDRQGAMVAVRANGYSRLPPLPYDEFIREHMMNADFAVSPPGNGIECVRHTESLLSGVAPILLRKGTFRFHECLPIVRVRSYREAKPAFLAEYREYIRERWAAGGYDLRRALLPYWLVEIYRAAGHL